MSSSSSSSSATATAPFETPARQVLRVHGGILKNKRPRDPDEDGVACAVEPGVRAKRCRLMLRKNTKRLHELCLAMYKTMLEAQKIKDESHACADFARLLSLSNESHQLSHFHWDELKSHHADLEKIFEVVTLPQWVVLWPLGEPYSPVKKPLLQRSDAAAEAPVALPLPPPSAQAPRVVGPDDTTTEGSDDDDDENPRERELTRSSSPSY
jgi:hypothetical protein